MVSGTVCHLVSDNSKVVKDGITNSFFRRRSETAIPTVAVRYFYEALYIFLYIFLQPSSPTSAPSPSPASPTCADGGGYSIQTVPNCKNNDFVEITGCSIKITIPITDPTTPNMVTIRDNNGKPIPDDVQIISDYTYTKSDYEDDGIRLISNEPIIGDSLVITLDVSSAVKDIRIRGVALQTPDQSGEVGKVCGQFS